MFTKFGRVYVPLGRHLVLTEFSLFPKSKSSMSTKSSLQAENSTFFWQEDGQKIPLRMHQNTPFHFI